MIETETQVDGVTLAASIKIFPLQMMAGCWLAWLLLAAAQGAGVVGFAETPALTASIWIGRTKISGTFWSLLQSRIFPQQRQNLDSVPIPQNNHLTAQNGSRTPQEKI